MATDLRTITTQARTVWSKLPGRRKALIVGVLAATVALLLVLSRGSAPRYAVLFSGLSPEDAGELVAELQSRGVPHRIEAGGSAISVPADKVLDLRLDLAEKGMPRGGGVGYEVFDQQAFGTTSFVEQMNYRRALQGELARTITSLDAVDGARVHLALGGNSLYRADDEPPTASVVVRLRRGATLGPGQVRGIVHLVASSVDGLAAERVTIVDERGEVLSNHDQGTGDGGDQQAIERALATRVQTLLEKIVGPGHVAVTVTAQLDRSQEATTEETFANQPVTRSESRIEERLPGTGGAGGVAGARGNLPGAPAPIGGPGDPGLVRLEETHNYEVSKTTRNVTQPQLRIARLHVAVVVDEVTDDSGAKVPRRADELARIESLTREAAGLDDARGDRMSVHSTAFSIADDEIATAVPASSAGSPLPGGVPIWAAAAAGGGVLLLAAVVMLARRRRRPKSQLIAGPPMTVAQLEASLDPAAAPALALPARDARERALEAARTDTSHAARVLSLWLAESPPATGGT